MKEGAGAREFGDAALDRIGALDVNGGQLHTERWRRGLDGGKAARGGGHGWIAKHRYTVDAGRDLLEQFQQLRAQTEFERDETGGVAARGRETRHQSAADRIDCGHEYNGNGPGHLLQGPDNRGGRIQN